MPPAAARVSSRQARRFMKALHKVIITGTGRAGTTFLVQLLTELGLDTGFTPETARAGIDGHSQAGLEHSLRGPKTAPTVRDWLRQPKHTIRDLLMEPAPGPYIIKNPAVCDTLEPALAGKRLIVDHVYIPVRDLEEAALSRARVGGGHGSVPGGLWKTGDPCDQKTVLAEMFFNLVYTLTVHDIPHTFLLFPRLVEDWAYTCHKLWFLVKGTETERFRHAFARVADRKRVHAFDRPEPKAASPEECAPARQPSAGSG